MFQNLNHTSRDHDFDCCAPMDETFVVVCKCLQCSAMADNESGWDNHLDGLMETGENWQCCVKMMMMRNPSGKLLEHCVVVESVPMALQLEAVMMAWIVLLDRLELAMASVGFHDELDLAKILDSEMMNLSWMMDGGIVLAGLRQRTARLSTTVDNWLVC